MKAWVVRAENADDINEKAFDEFSNAQEAVTDAYRGGSWNDGAGSEGLEAARHEYIREGKVFARLEYETVRLPTEPLD